MVARGFNDEFTGRLLTLVDHRIASLPSLRLNAVQLIPVTDEDIEKELIAGNYIKELQYDDIDSFRRFLNRCGLSRLAGRPRGSKNRT